MNTLSIPVNSLLEQAKIEPYLFGEPNQFVLENKVWHFLGLAADYKQMPHLGSLVTEQTDISNYGEFAEQLLGAGNLYQCLQLLVNEVSLDNESNAFWLEESEECIWICRPRYPYYEEGRWQAEQHTMSFLCMLIECYAGVGWIPRQVKFQEPDGLGLSSSRFFANADIQLGQQYSAIAIEPALLIDRSGGVNAMSELANSDENIMQGFKLLLKQNYFGQNWLAENIAMELGMSVRTLKRKLHAQETSLRSIFDEMRFQQACDLIEQDIHDYAILAERLSYTHPNNFVRAFKRWSGITPREYIRLRNLELMKKVVWQN